MGWADMAMVARSEGKLKEVAAALEQEHKVRAHVVTADLAKQGAADALVATLDARGIDVDVLVNNAGYASYGAFEKPQVFGYVGSQSGSYFWDNESLVSRAQQTAPIAVRFYLDHGCPNDNCDSNRDLNNALTQKGYDVVHVEVPNAQHDWSYWKARQPQLLHDFAVKATCE